MTGTQKVLRMLGAVQRLLAPSDRKFIVVELFLESFRKTPPSGTGTGITAIDGMPAAPA